MTESRSSELSRERLQLRLRGAAAPGCADATALASEVSELLGWRGVGPDAAPRIVDVLVERSLNQLVATVSWLGSDGEEIGRRELAVGVAECGRLHQALVFSLAVERGFDPNRSQGSGKPQDPQPAKAPPPGKHPPAQDPKPGPKARPATEYHWSVAAGVAARGSVVPEFGFGPQLSFGYRKSWFSLELRTLLLLPRDHAVANATGFQYWEAASSVLACGGTRILRMCPGLEVFYARVRGFGGSVIPSSDAGLGLRVGGVMSVALPLTKLYSAGVQAGLWLPARRHDVQLGNAAVWSAGVGYSAGLELRRDFL